jgi:predicted nucleic acid-binding protein
MRDLRTFEGHEFWPDDLSFLTSPSLDVSAMTSPGRVTDTYLLALAVAKGGSLATFDSRLSPMGVHGGREALHIIA